MSVAQSAGHGVAPLLSAQLGQLDHLLRNPNTFLDLTDVCSDSPSNKASLQHLKIA